MVFHDLKASPEGDISQLIWGGSLVQQFDNASLAVSERTGRFYHKLFVPEGRRGGAKIQRQQQEIQQEEQEEEQEQGKAQRRAEFGLLKSSVAGQVAANISYGRDDGSEPDCMFYRTSTGGEDGKGKLYKIMKLPKENESDAWGCPPLM